MIVNPANSGNAGESLHPFFDDINGSGDTYLDITGTAEEIDAAYNLSLKDDTTISIGLCGTPNYGEQAVLFAMLQDPKTVYPNRWVFNAPTVYTRDGNLGYGGPNFTVEKTSATSLRISTTASWAVFYKDDSIYTRYAVKF